MIKSYTGLIKDGTLHGDGIAVYANDEKYEGMWVYGKRHGQVSHHKERGRAKSFIHTWVSICLSLYSQPCRMLGSHTRWKALCLRIYVQYHIIKNLPLFLFDQGNYTYADGSVYKGQWDNDKIHGTGKSLLDSWIENMTTGLEAQ